MSPYGALQLQYPVVCDSEQRSFLIGCHWREQLGSKGHSDCTKGVFRDFLWSWAFMVYAHMLRNLRSYSNIPTIILIQDLISAWPMKCWDILYALAAGFVMPEPGCASGSPGNLLKACTDSQAPLHIYWFRIFVGRPRTLYFFYQFPLVIQL